MIGKGLNHPGSIGVFDSGVGGLTVLKELLLQLPGFNYIYFADNAYCPYGSLSKETITIRSHKIVEFLKEKGCQMVVVACNTATAGAIDSLRETHDIPFVGMEPAIKPAALATQTKAIGVLATAGTFKGRLYRETTQRYAQGIEVIYQVGEGLVELVENGEYNSSQAFRLLERYIEPMLEANVDHIVLGCTHYPYFIPILQKMLPRGIVIVDPAPAVAKQARRVMESGGGSPLPPATNAMVEFYSSASTKTLAMLSSLLDGITIQSVSRASL